MPRVLLFSLVLLGAPFVQVRDALPGPRDLAIERDRIVWVEEGPFVMGPTRGDVLFAILLCQDEHDLAVAEGCAEARFDHEGAARREALLPD